MLPFIETSIEMGSGLEISSTQERLASTNTMLMMHHAQISGDGEQVAWWVARQWDMRNL
jgi:hypothetical protein